MEPQNNQELQNSYLNVQRLKELSQLIDNGEKVEEVMKLPGWEEILEPMLSKMIIDVVGGKQNGRWHNGSLGDKRLGEERLKCLSSYKCALTDFHSYVYDFVDQLPQLRKEYEELVKEEFHEEKLEVASDYDIIRNY